MKSGLLTIEGNIGAGKTTLVKKLAGFFGAQMLLEEFEDNPFLPKFYGDPGRYAFPLELSFMADRYAQMKEVPVGGSLFPGLVISDYVFYKSLIFASVNLKEDELKLYKTLFHIINPNLPQPDVLIYVYRPVERLLENIGQRGRGYENAISADYLMRVHENYLTFFKQSRSGRTIILNAEHLDFIKSEEDFESIVDLISTDNPPGIEYVGFDTSFEENQKGLI